VFRGALRLVAPALGFAIVPTSATARAIDFIQPVKPI
jgi:hypothetical protein